jgi:hypothetical protein
MSKDIDKISTKIRGLEDMVSDGNLSANVNRLERMLREEWTNSFVNVTSFRSVYERLHGHGHLPEPTNTRKEIQTQEVYNPPSRSVRQMDASLPTHRDPNKIPRKQAQTVPVRRDQDTDIRPRPSVQTRKRPERPDDSLRSPPKRKRDEDEATEHHSRRPDPVYSDEDEETPERPQRRREKDAERAEKVTFFKYLLQ